MLLKWSLGDFVQFQQRFSAPGQMSNEAFFSSSATFLSPENFFSFGGLTARQTKVININIFVLMTEACSASADVSAASTTDDRRCGVRKSFFTSLTAATITIYYFLPFHAPRDCKLCSLEITLCHMLFVLNQSEIETFNILLSSSEVPLHSGSVSFQ